MSSSWTSLSCSVLLFVFIDDLLPGHVSLSDASAGLLVQWLVSADQSSRTVPAAPSGLAGDVSD